MIDHQLFDYCFYLTKSYESELFMFIFGCFSMICINIKIATRNNQFSKSENSEFRFDGENVYQIKNQTNQPIIMTTNKC